MPRITKIPAPTSPTQPAPPTPRTCVQCGTPLRRSLKRFCSQSCQAEYRRTVPLDELLALLRSRTMSLTAIARRYGVSQQRISQLAARHGIPVLVMHKPSKPRAPKPPPKLCACGKPARCRGLCASHYQQWMKCEGRIGSRTRTTTEPAP